LGPVSQTEASFFFWTETLFNPFLGIGQFPEKIRVFLQFHKGDVFFLREPCELDSSFFGLRGIKECLEVTVPLSSVPALAFVFRPMKKPWLKNHGRGGPLFKKISTKILPR